MNTYKKTLTPVAAAVVAVSLPSAAFAGDQNIHTVAVQTEIPAEDIPVMTDIIFEAALANAASKTLDENKDWFRVVYRDARTETVTRNASSDAESRYLDMEDGERIYLEIPTSDVTVQVQKIDFEMGSGPKPADGNSFVAKKLILPDS